MQKNFESRCGLALLISVFLMFITMLLHPAGGSFEYLLKISRFIMITHSLALISIPFAALGFWGLTKYLQEKNILSIGAFITMAFGLFAVLCAAATNGLALPIFISHYRDATPETLDTVKIILSYNSSLNHAFDLIYIGASCISVLLWSIVIIKTRRLPIWLGWIGVLLTLLAIGSMIAGFVFVDLSGFRIFVGGFVIWTLLIGWHLLTTRQ